MFEPLVTTSELETFMGTTLPENALTLISRASDIIWMATRRNYNSLNDAHENAMKLATCAQVQDWTSKEQDGVANDNVKAYSLGSLSVDFSTSEEARNKLCVSAARYLNSQNLLYKGLR